MTVQSVGPKRDEDAPRMERRPGTRTLTVRDLMERAQRGEIRIPSFQRPFRWENSDRVALLDSIDRGYPIGTMLFWQRKIGANVGALMSHMPAPERSDAWLVIDGQQRLKTLVDALLTPPSPGQHALAFDREMDRFQMRRYRTDDEPRFVPAHVLLDNSELSQWVIDRGVEREGRKEIFDLGTRIRDYNVLAYVVVDEDETVLRRVFERTNASGKALSREEVFDALAGTLAAGEIQGVRGVAAAVRDRGFGSIDESTAGNTLAALVGGHPDSEKPKQLEPDQLGVALSRTTVALARALDFLRDEALMPSASVVPYQLPIVVLAVFFDRFANCEPRTRTLLRRWVWRGALAERLSGASGTLAAHVKDVLVTNEQQAIEALLARTGGSTRVDATVRDKFVFGNARPMLELCALVALRPRDLQTRSELDVRALLSIDEPAKSLRSIINMDRNDCLSLASSIANRLLHPGVSKTNVARLIQRCDDPATLLSHGISTDAFDALNRRDMQGFLEQRKQTLERWFERFFAEKCEWDADDSPSIASMLIQTKRVS